jgi:hypothetical protein
LGEVVLLEYGQLIYLQDAAMCSRRHALQPITCLDYGGVEANKQAKSRLQGKRLSLSLSLTIGRRLAGLVAMANDR